MASLRKRAHGRSFWTLASLGSVLVLLCLCALRADAQHQSVLITAQSWAWYAPPGATNFTVTLWGAGGAGAQSSHCSAAGGSGGAVIGRPVATASWVPPIAFVRWEATVGQGGVPYYDDGSVALGGNGGATTLVARDPMGAVLFSATAYGGGGGYAFDPDCRGGAGAGTNSSASWQEPGKGTPPGADGRWPEEGAQMGDVKAGGSGGWAHSSAASNDSSIDGADWGAWQGGHGTVDGLCKTAGGAAGYNGAGGSGSAYPGGQVDAAPNSGAGGGAGKVCGGPLPERLSGVGGSGGIIIEYDGPAPLASPSNSATPSPSRAPASPSRTPSSTPSPSPYAFQVYLSWSTTTNSYLSARPDGSVKIASAPLEWERWTATRLPSGLWTFKSYFNTYLSAQMDGSMKADRTEAKEWEGFEIFYPGGNLNRWILKTYFGRYVDKSGDQIITSTNSNLFWSRTFV
jgi:hypothetical protein